jgi:hypothetical protein
MSRENLSFTVVHIKRGIKTMADTPTDLLARKDQISSRYATARQSLNSITTKRTEMVRNALLASGALPAPPDRIITFTVENDSFDQWEGQVDPNWDLRVRLSASNFHITVNIETAKITKFSTSGISSNIRSADDEKDLVDAAEYYLAVAELLANGNQVAEAIKSVVAQLDPDYKSALGEFNRAAGDHYALERAEREAEQAALTASAAPGMMWVPRDGSNRRYSESATYYAVRVDKMTSTAAILTAFGYTGADYRSKEPTIMLGNTKRLHKKGIAPAKVLAEYYKNTGLTEAEFNAEFKVDPKAFIVKYWQVRE